MVSIIARHGRTSLFSILFTLLIINFYVLMALLGVHELSHSYTAIYLGCENVVVSFDVVESLVYTSVSCSTESVVFWVAIAGLLVTVFLSFSFILLGNSPERHLWLVSLGFSVFLASNDILFLWGDLARFFGIFASTIFIAFGNAFFIEDHFEFVSE